MTTPTPTSDPSAGAGLPDLGLLNALAGEFFAALPGVGPVGAARAALPSPHAAGGVPVPSNPLPGGFSPGPLANGPALPGTLVPGGNVVPTSPQSGANLVASTPALVPHAAAPNGLPDAVVTAAPAFEPRLGGQALGVPEAFAAALPDVGASAGRGAGASGHPAPSVPSSPYYFLSETGVPQAAAPEVAASTDDRVSAQSFGLPGADTLRSLLADRRDTGRPAKAPIGGASSTGAAPGYYFVDGDSLRYAGQGRSAQDVPQAGTSARVPFDVHAIRRDFPILQERVNGRPLVWFDNAATTQKPQSVIDRVSYFYEHENSNIHRAAHELAARATDAYEKARETVRRFIGANSVDEVIFVRGATEAINLVAKTWGVQNIQEGDEIIVSNLEHHANIVPWQQLAAQKGAKIRVIPVDDTGQVLLGEYQRLLNPRTKLVSVTQVSNALGTVVPVAEIVEMAHRAGAKTLVDGAQSVSHLRVDVRSLDTDFFVFSGHKIFGPTGIGVVYGKKALLEEMPPWQGGGNMIADVTFERTVFQPPPNKFEAGTGNIADAVGLGAALDYVERVGIENIARYEHDLLEYATHGLVRIPGLRLIGTARDKASVASFVLAGYSTEEVGKALNQEGIAVRSGHHCAQPILRRFGVEATVRPSLAFYNTCEEVDLLVQVVSRLARTRR